MTTTPATPPPGPPGAGLHLGGEAYANPALEPLLRPVGEVSTFPGNPRRHDQDNITSSVRDHGLYAAVVTQASSGHVIVGNGRLQALIDLGAERVPVVPQDVDDTRARAIVARDNQTSDASENDPTLLYDLLAPLAEDPELLALAGFSEDEVDDLHALLQETEPDPLPDPGPGSSNERQSNTFDQDGAGYADRAQRLLVLTLPPEPYAWLVGALGRIAAQQGNSRQSNTMTVLKLAGASLGEDPPVMDETPPEA